MSLLPIEKVRGEDWVAEHESGPIPTDIALLAPDQVARDLDLPGLESADLDIWLDRPVYRLSTGETVHLTDAVTGKLLSPVNSDVAREVASRDYAGPGTVARVILQEEPLLEIRGRDLPQWRVEFDDSRNTTVYVSPQTGKVTGRRNTIWRVYDFFWMLHIMDYSERDDFNHPLLIGSAVVAFQSSAADRQRGGGMDPGNIGDMAGGPVAEQEKETIQMNGISGTRIFLSVIAAVLIGLPGVAFCDEVHVAVAANFADCMEELGTLFEQNTGHQLVISRGSTGKHFAQIKAGAPFDVFFAADSARPALLEAEGLTVPGSRFTYAIGELVLWMAIANPRLAPYGLAAKQALTSLGIWDELEPRLVMGQSVGQTWQFVATGNAQLGLVAQSQLAPH